MGVIAVHIKKMQVERNKVPSGKISVKNNIAVQTVTDRNIALGAAQQKGLNFGFSFTCAYEPEIGAINVEGEVLYVDAESKITQLKKAWDEKKVLPDDVRASVVNAAVTKCTVQAIKLSEDLNLPPPVALPRVKQN